MTSNKTTASLFRTIVFFMLGLALSAYGLFQSVSRYPSADNLARFTDALPTISAVASFGLGIVASLVGLVLLVPSIIHLRGRKQPQERMFPTSLTPYADRGAPARRPVPSRREEDFDMDPDGCSGDDYRGGFGGRQHDNGEYDERPWANSYS
jgi:hypothetical protein